MPGKESPLAPVQKAAQRSFIALHQAEQRGLLPGVSEQMSRAAMVIGPLLRTFGSNGLFFVVIIASSVLFHGVACWPEMVKWLADAAQKDLGRHFAATARESVGGYLTGRFLTLWFIVVLLHYVVCLPQARYRLLRTLTLSLALFHNGTMVLIHNGLNLAQYLRKLDAAGMSFERQWLAIRELKLIEHPPLDRPLGPSREQLLAQGIRTRAALHRCVMECYRRDCGRLAASWAMTDDSKRKALYIMNFVSGLWGYGNRSNPDEPGGVQANEENAGRTRLPGLRDYLEASIGDCTDFAYLTKILLDCEGYSNRLTAIPGHVFNEAQIDGHWCILDPTTNLFVESGWEELYTSARSALHPVAVHLFPLAGMMDEESSRFRPLAGQFRLMTVLRIANRPTHLKATSHPELPAYLRLSEPAESHDYSAAPTSSPEHRPSFVRHTTPGSQD